MAGGEDPSPRRVSWSQSLRSRCQAGARGGWAGLTPLKDAAGEGGVGKEDLQNVRGSATCDRVRRARDRAAILRKSRPTQ